MQIAAGEWQPLLQSVILGLIFSYLVAKLISIILSLKDDNLAVTRRRDVPIESLAAPTPPNDRDDFVSTLSELDTVMAEKGTVCSLGNDNDDDDWEGVESTELDEAFSAATAFMAAAAAADRLSQKVSSDPAICSQDDCSR